MHRLLPLIVLLLALPACQPEPALEAATNADTPAADAQVPTLTEAWRVTAGLALPESVVYDEARDALYVSNIGSGDVNEPDGNGYLSKIGTDGQVIEEAWVVGLDGPKGLALDGDRLYVADIDELLEVDVEAGTVLNRYPVEGAAFLNDVALGEGGAVFVSDSGTGRIHRLADGQMEVWLDDPNVRSPNGLHLADGDLVVAAADSTAENAGGARYVRRVSAADHAVEPLGTTSPVGGLDAVEPDGRGGFFVSDWGAGQVHHYAPEAGATLLLELSQGTADLDYAAGRLYLPVMIAGELIAYEVAWP